MKCPVCEKDFDFPAYFTQEYKVKVGSKIVFRVTTPRMKAIGQITKPICPWCDSQLFDQDVIDYASKLQRSEDTAEAEG